MPVAIVERQYPFPYRTRKSSSLTPMILHFCGKVGSCRLFLFNEVKKKKPKQTGGLRRFFAKISQTIPAKVQWKCLLPKCQTRTHSVLGAVLSDNPKMTRCRSSFFNGFPIIG